MLWVSNWWGITIIAENDEDKAFLQKLQEMLPQKAGYDEPDYLNGEIKRLGVYENGELKSKLDEGKFSLVFHR
jgi:hypothetical protein